MRRRAERSAVTRRGATKAAALAPGERMSLRVLGVGSQDAAVVRAAIASLVVPMEGSIVTIESRGEEVGVLDRSRFLVVPARSTVTLRGTASAAASRTAVLGIGSALVAHAARTYQRYGFDAARLGKHLEQVAVLPRTVWVHEIVHRYVFERYALGEEDNEATRFLETEIVKELWFLFRDRDAGADRATQLQRYSRVVSRAIAEIESRLFEPCRVADIAARVGASESTLLRSFRREVGSTPVAFWRNRKLDEALVLLRAGDHSIAEVAARAGYDNASAFTHAFRSRFGRVPSSFLPRRPVRRAP